MSTEFESALTKAKVEFLQREDAVFISTVCFYLDLIEDDTQPTLCTNGKYIKINPQFFMSLSKSLQVSALAHETHHVVYDHMDRCGDRDPQKYNRAGDYRINLDLKDAGYEIGATWLLDEQYRPYTTEQIYDLLPDEPEEGKECWADLVGGDSPEEKQETREYIQEVIMQAATAARMAGAPGSIPGHVQVYLDGLLKPKLPLEQHLRKFFTDLGKNDYTWTRPNRRHIVHGHYLPSQKSGELMHLAFAFDMSASVSDYDIKRYVSELTHVLKMMKPDKLTLVQFDWDIKSVDVIRNVSDMMRVKLHGRGGTSVHPLMDWAVATKPNALIVFSDGEYAHPVVKPKCPVLWLIHGSSRNNFKCSFGQTIRFDVSELREAV